MQHKGKRRKYQDLEFQYGLVQSMLELSDEEMLAILADQNQHIDLSLSFEAEVVKADYSNELKPVIEYSLKTVATASLYNAKGLVKEAGREMTTSDFGQENPKTGDGTMTGLYMAPLGLVLDYVLTMSLHLFIIAVNGDNKHHERFFYPSTDQ